MKTLIILLLCTAPCLAFSQAMHLPGVSLHRHMKITKAGNPDTLTAKNAAALTSAKADTSQKTAAPVKVAGSGKADTSGTGTASSPIKYKAAVLSTDFTVPLMRVNLLNKTTTNTSNALVSTSFLNSAGAGLTYSWGELDETLDNDGNTASIDYYNRFGLQLGFLFASNSSSGASSTNTSASSSTSATQSTIFALVAGFSVLNIQFGIGYEFGSLAASQKREFLTLNYAIPVSTLINGGYRIFHLKKLPPNSLY